MHHFERVNGRRKALLTHIFGIMAHFFSWNDVVLADWNVTVSKIIAILTNNGSSMQKAQLIQHKSSDDNNDSKLDPEELEVT